MKKILIEAGGVKLEAELNESKTAQAIYEALPLEARGSRWGDEIYFSTPVKLGPEEGARAEVEVGALAYWPPGNAFCIFFGPTPASTGSQPQAASPVNVFGRVLGDATLLKDTPHGVKVKVSKLEE
ncbi:MAG: hypothetical protein GX766_03340 [Firmicutes bacterium]|nr:hypothetical protein [Bacillota bacterium]HQD39780.1 cyclophilin-like fold protein [Bacillota bacterium]